MNESHFQVTRGPPEVAFSQILGTLRATALKRLPELYIIGAFESNSVGGPNIQISDLVAWHASCVWFPGSNHNRVHNFFQTRRKSQQGRVYRHIGSVLGLV